MHIWKVTVSHFGRVAGIFSKSRGKPLRLPAWAGLVRPLAPRYWEDTKVTYTKFNLGGFSGGGNQAERAVGTILNSDMERESL
jgi:hypothetical protein